MFKKLLGSLKGDGYQARATRSTVLVLFNFGAENVLRLASNLVLTRILFPEAFGMMALVQVVVAGALMFSDFGFSGAIIQDKRGDDPDFLNTAWTMQIIRGILLMGGIMLAAGPAAEFYETPELAELLYVAALVPFLKGLVSTRVFTANRTLQMERLIFMTIGTQVVGTLVTVLLAWWLESVWALALGLPVSPIMMVILSHTVLEGHPNRLGFDRASGMSLFRYGGFIFISSAAGFFAMHGDRAVLAKYVSLNDLAMYNIAFLFASVPRKLCNAVSDKVIFPLYARRPPAESANNRHKINKARRLVTGPLLFSVLALALIGDAMIELLYDDRYRAAGPYLVLMALAFLPDLILLSYVRLPLASGHSGRFAVFQTASALIRLGVLILLVPGYGILGAVLAIAVGMLVTYPFLLYLIRPYKAWDPVHDAAYMGVGFVITLTILWIHSDTLQPVLAPLF